jgi:hypothetical protein
MTLQEIKQKLYDLKVLEERLLADLLYESYDEQTQVTMKIFEVCDYIVRLQIILKEIYDEDT